MFLKSIFIPLIKFRGILIPLIVLIIGFVFEKSHLWIPISVFPAGIILYFTSNWVTDRTRVGYYKTLSHLLKFVCSLIGIYAMLGTIACIGLLFFWFVF